MTDRLDIISTDVLLYALRAVVDEPCIPAHRYSDEFIRGIVRMATEPRIFGEVVKFAREHKRTEKEISVLIHKVKVGTQPRYWSSIEGLIFPGPRPADQRWNGYASRQKRYEAMTQSPIPGKPRDPRISLLNPRQKADYLILRKKGGYSVDEALKLVGFQIQESPPANCDAIR